MIYNITEHRHTTSMISDLSWPASVESVGRAAGSRKRKVRTTVYSYMNIQVDDGRAHACIDRHRHGCIKCSLIDRILSSSVSCVKQAQQQGTRSQSQLLLSLFIFAFHCNCSSSSRSIEGSMHALLAGRPELTLNGIHDEYMHRDIQSWE